MPYVTCNFCGHAGIQELDIDVCMNCITRGNAGNDAILIYAIKKYLEKHPGVKVREVKKDLRIEQKTMDRLLKEGSLQLVNGTDLESLEPIKPDTPDDRKRQKIQNLRSQLANPNSYGGYYGKSKLVEDLEKRRNGQDISR